MVDKHRAEHEPEQQTLPTSNQPNHRSQGNGGQVSVFVQQHQLGILREITYDAIIDLAGLDAEDPSDGGKQETGVAGRGGVELGVGVAMMQTMLGCPPENAPLGGRLAQLGARLIDAAAKKLADEFFANLASELDTVELPAEEIATEAGGGLAVALWIGGLILLVLASLALFAGQ